MRPVARIALILLAAFTIAIFPRTASAETLRDVITRSATAPDMRSLIHLDRQISSYAVLDDARWFAVAYYVQGNSDMLEAPLYIDRYDRGARLWRFASISQDQLRAGAVDCVGAALSFSAAADEFLVATHLNASAQCTLVLTNDLALRTTLYGWPLATTPDGSVVYHRSQIHFAPVHAAEIAVYNRKTGRSYAIYPAKPYQAVRQAEIAKLTQFFDAHTDWCNHYNNPCDPEVFDNSLEGQVVTSAQTDSLAFIIDYGTDPEDPAAPPVTAGHRKVVYVYRNVSNEFNLQYREMLLSGVTARFGSGPLSQLLTPARLQQIFVH